MDSNPWYVDSIHSFAVFKCPECIFDSKGEGNFQNHAIENHPMSLVLFGKAPKFYTFSKILLNPRVQF